MKLLNRTIYILITTMLFVFLVGSFVFYQVLKSSTEKEVSDELNARMEFIEKELSTKPEQYRDLYIPGYITIEELNSGENLPGMFMDTILLNLEDNSYELYKALRKDVENDSTVYRVYVYNSLVESNELIERIILIVTIIFILFIFFLYLINHFLLERVWSDFFNTVQKLKSYNVDAIKNIKFSDSDITEFKLLNAALNQMIEKIRTDYENVKQFTGNISHEIQTPLSVIRLKSDLLLQTAPLTNEQARLIGDIQKTNSRLSKLNKTLVLLTKIENNQFPLKEQISITEVTERHLEVFSSITIDRDISIRLLKEGEFVVDADPMLVDVLILNLIKNAVMHNRDHGELNIIIGEQKLLISNSGLNADLSNEDIFHPYKKVGKGEGTFGLGLSLVKNICDLYNLKLVYTYTDGLHSFTLSVLG